jgi:hypothetical protein
MGLLMTKNFRIIQESKELLYSVKRDETKLLSNDEETDTDFSNYFLIDAKNVIIYTMVLPLQVEENLKSVVHSFATEKVPMASDYKIDYAYIKDKGKLKIFISVIKQEKYDEIRAICKEKVEKLSGIIPEQILYYAFAVQKGIKNGLCLFSNGNSKICFFIENGFPLNFVKIKQETSIISFLSRFASSIRKDFEVCEKHFFGQPEEIEEDLSMFKQYTSDFSLPEILLFFEKSKQIPNLNLLPIKERAVDRKIWKYIFITAGLLLSIYYLVQFAGDYRELKKEVEKYEIKLKKEKVAAMQLSKLLDEADTLQEEVNFLKKYEKQKKKVLLALSEITRLAPDDTYATSIKVNDRNNQVEITGKSKNVYELQRSLSKSKYLKELKKPGTVRKDKGGYDTFVMRGKIVF